MRSSTRHRPFSGNKRLGKNCAPEYAARVIALMQMRTECAFPARLEIENQ